MSDPRMAGTSETPSAPTAPAPAAGWAAPGAAPFGPPLGYSPAYAAPGTHSAPAAPPPYDRAPMPQRARGLGVVAFVLSLIATVVAPTIALIAAMEIVRGTGNDWSSAMMTGVEWSLLTPVRGWVLLGEIAFWVGTALGTWALVQGIVAIVARRGRGYGIAALVISAVGVIVFAIALQMGLVLGLVIAVGDGTIV